MIPSALFHPTCGTHPLVNPRNSTRLHNVPSFLGCVWCCHPPPDRYQEVAMGGGQQEIAVTLLKAASQVRKKITKIPKEEKMYCLEYLPANNEMPKHRDKRKKSAQHPIESLNNKPPYICIYNLTSHPTLHRADTMNQPPTGLDLDRRLAAALMNFLDTLPSDGGQS